MKAFYTAVTEIVGLFVEDGSLAIGIVVWLAIAAFVFPRISDSAGWRSPVMFAGLVVLLVENVLRSARKHLKKL
jgi:hypothetical protein